MSPLRWTCKSTRQLARLLTANGHRVSHMKVAQLWAQSPVVGAAERKSS
jgi:Rhodopirellula transposase DDE domain